MVNEIVIGMRPVESLNNGSGNCGGGGGGSGEKRRI